MCRAPLAPPSPTNAEPGPTALKTKCYTWDGKVRDWVSTPPFWLGPTPAHEHLYLKNWQQRRLAKERLEGERLEQLEGNTEAEEE
ncbi:Pre-mRNA-processing factor 39 [Hordeum vulgare]|nr:Pre-mRNA-processing factor 39 [Hordeum vulgare]